MSQKVEGDLLSQEVNARGVLEAIALHLGFRSLNLWFPYYPPLYSPPPPPSPP